MFNQVRSVEKIVDTKFENIGKIWIKLVKLLPSFENGKTFNKLVTFRIFFSFIEKLVTFFEKNVNLQKTHITFFKNW